MSCLLIKKQQLVRVGMVELGPNRPISNPLALSNLITDPIETHIHSLGMSLADGVISNTAGSAIIGDNGSRRLRMTEFSQDVANSKSRKKGSLNRADYFTKHHPAFHHTLMCPRYLHCPPSLPGPSNYYACLASAAGPLSPPPFLPESAGEGALIPTYGIL